MLASAATLSAATLAYADVAAASPAVPEPQPEESSTTTEPGEKSSPPTTQWPAPVAQGKVITATTEMPPPTTDSTVSTASTASSASTAAEPSASDPASSTSIGSGSSSSTAVAVTTPSVSSTTSANEVGTGLAPVPSGIDGGAVVAQGGPVLSTPAPGAAGATASAAHGIAHDTLPTTGQSIEMPVFSGIGIALIGAALLRLRRRPGLE